VAYHRILKLSNNKNSENRLLPPSPHRSWTAADRLQGSRKLSSEEAKELLNKMWDEIDNCSSSDDMNSSEVL